MWQSRIRVGQSVLEHFWDEFRANENNYVGLHGANAQAMGENTVIFDNLNNYAESGKAVYVNRFLSSIASMNAETMWRRPWHYLRARRASGPQGDELRIVTEAALNFLLANRRNNWLLKARVFNISTELWMGILKLVYTPHEGTAPEDEERLGEIVTETMHVETGEGGTEPQEVVSYVGGPPRLDDQGLPIIKGKTKYVIETRNPADYYQTRVIYPPNLTMDTECGNDPHDATWMAERTSWRYDQFISNPLFAGARGDILDYARFVDTVDLSKRTRDRFNSKTLPRTLGQGGSDNIDDADRDRMRLWGYQCWDPVAQEITYLVDGYEKVAAKVEYPRYIHTYPYSFAKFHERVSDIIPISEVSQSRPIVNALSELSSMHLTHARRFSRWYIAKEGMFDSAAKAMAKDGEDGRIAEFKSRYSTADFQPVEDAPLSPDVYRLRVQFIEDFGELIGRGGEGRAVAQSDTATQAALVSGTTTSRDNDRRAIVAQGLEHHAQLMLGCFQDTIDTSVAFRIQGPDGIPLAGIATKARVQGDYDVDIDLQEMEPHDQAAEKRDLNEIVQILGLPVFASPTFSKRFWTARRVHDPQLAKELTALGQQMLQQMMTQGEQGTGGSSQGGASPGKQGPQQGRTEEGRSSGRNLRVVAGAGERGGNRGKT